MHMRRTYWELLRELVRERSKIRLGETYRFWEADKYIHVVDVAGIKGFVNGQEDLLVSGFWAYWLATLRDIDVPLVATNAYVADRCFTSSDPNLGAAWIQYGTSTNPESFTQYSLANSVGGISTAISLGQLTDRNSVSFSGILPDRASEIGIYQYIRCINASGYSVNIYVMLSRRVGSWAAQTAVVETYELLQPWTYPAAAYLYGLLSNADVSNIRVDGAAFTHRTSGDSNAGSMYLVASDKSIAWSPRIYAIPNAFSIGTSYVDVLNRTDMRATMLIGVIAPQSDMTVNTLGVYQNVWDVNSVSQTIAILAIPLSQPITFYAGKNNMVMLRLIAL